MANWGIHQGDCIEVMRSMKSECIDAMITDPPYGLEFMGKKWDGEDGFRRSLNQNDVNRDNAFGRTSRTSPEYKAGHLFQEWTEAWAKEALRVLKPGGYLSSFGGTRTYHRLACAVEDVGFEIRDSLHWIYGNGFPKSLNISRSIDEHLCVLPGRHYWYETSLPKGDKAKPDDHVCLITPEGAAQTGKGTALKPAHEPIILARKPLVGTVAANVLEYGTGGIDVDGGRIHGEDVPAGRMRHGGGVHSEKIQQLDPDKKNQEPAGRWPPNILLTHSVNCVDEYCVSDCPIAELNRQSGPAGQLGPQLNGDEPSAAESGSITGLRKRVTQKTRHNDSGGASKFYPNFRYCAKPARKERDAGCDSLESKTGGEATDREDGSAGVDNPRAGAGRTGGAKNYHPTVKPISLMRWLCRLVTPLGGVVLDPFVGSGTTGIGAVLEGFNFIGIEQSAEYIEIAKKRIEHWQKGSK